MNQTREINESSINWFVNCCNDIGYYLNYCIHQICSNRENVDYEKLSSEFNTNLLDDKNILSIIDNTSSDNDDYIPFNEFD